MLDTSIYSTYTHYEGQLDIVYCFGCTDFGGIVTASTVLGTAMQYGTVGHVDFRGITVDAYAALLRLLAFGFHHLMPMG